MIETLLDIFEAGLSIWETSQSRKYQEAVLDLKQKRANELDKETPDLNLVDRYERDLFYLARLASAQIRGQKAEDLQRQK